MAANTLIVSFCGFDSVPSDLGTLHAVSSALQKYPDGMVHNVDNVFNMQGAGVSGGTVASVMNIFETTPIGDLRRSMNPFFLNPESHGEAPVPVEHDQGMRYVYYELFVRTQVFF